MSAVAAIVLAAGASTRMGRPKQLLPLDGVPMLARVVAVARVARCDPIVVVLGRDAAACRAAIDPPSAQAVQAVRFVDNPDWSAGMGTSLRAGAAALPSDVSGAFVLLADQPLVSPATLERLTEAAARSNRPVAVASFVETVGPPVFVTADYLSRLRHWPNAGGAKRLWTERAEDVVRVACPEAALDVDTPADYESLGRVGEAGGYHSDNSGSTR